VAVRRTSRWRRAFWCGGVVAALACGLVATIAYLSPTDDLLWQALVRGTVDRGRTAIGTAVLTRRDGRWAGRVSDLPPGTATHFQPGATYGFFVVSLADGLLLALADRSAVYGARVYWYDPLPLTPGRPAEPLTGFQDHAHGSMYQADGRRLAGPVWRDLDPYALTIIEGTVYIASRATCPTPQRPVEMWCR
jgi:hypothetical protein